MTENERQLLLKDLCERLPYGVMCDFAYNPGNPQKLLYVTPYDEKEQIHLVAKEYKFGNGSYGPSDFDVEKVKPYLRPMSSMTDKEKEEFKDTFNGFFQYFNHGIISDSRVWDKNEAVFVGELSCSRLIDWLNAHHFDYRGLLPMGLALEAPDGMYKTE